MSQISASPRVGGYYLKTMDVFSIVIAVVEKLSSLLDSYSQSTREDFQTNFKNVSLSRSVLQAKNQNTSSGFLVS